MGAAVAGRSRVWLSLGREPAQPGRATAARSCAPRPALQAVQARRLLAGDSGDSRGQGGPPPAVITGAQGHRGTGCTARVPPAVGALGPRGRVPRERTDLPGPRTGLRGLGNVLAPETLP